MIVVNIYTYEFSGGQPTSFRHSGAADGTLNNSWNIAKLILSAYIYYMRFWWEQFINITIVIVTSSQIEYCPDKTQLVNIYLTILYYQKWNSFKVENVQQFQKTFIKENCDINSYKLWRKVVNKTLYRNRYRMVAEILSEKET